MKFESSEIYKIDIIMQLQQLRISRGISQRELARRIGVRHGTICDMENHKSSPNIDLVIKYALTLGYKLKLDFL